MSDSRSKNATRNIVSGTFNKILTLFLPFLIRTVIIRQLGADYLGLGSLFASILQVLNMTELGFSSAVVFSLYKPIAEGDTETICALLSFYRKVYKIVGAVITVLGLLLIPFLPYLIKDGEYPSDINLYVLYLLNLFATAVSYFAFAYKSVILTASQRQDLISTIDSFSNVSKYVIQIIVLIIWKNYYLYFIWNLFFVIANNFIVAYVTNKYYPHYQPKGTITQASKSEIVQKIKGIAIGKFSFVARNSFDSIVLSMFCGLTDVVIYSNYYYVFSAIIGFIGVLVQALTAGVGNSVATDTVDKNYYDFRRFYFIFSMIGGFCTVCLFCLYQPFMHVWAGKELTASLSVMILFCVYFYITQMSQVRAMYSNAAGIWWELRTISIAEMVFNLLLNFVLGYFWGMSGILWATIITAFVCSIVGFTIVTYRVYFKHNVMDYFKDSGIYIVSTVGVALVTNQVCCFIHQESWTILFVKAIICSVLSALLFFGVFSVSPRFRDYFKSIVKNVTSKKMIKFHM